MPKLPGINHLDARARQGMAIFVPKGEPTDPTREPRFYEGTYRYLRELGIEELQ